MLYTRILTREHVRGVGGVSSSARLVQSPCGMGCRNLIGRPVSGAIVVMKFVLLDPSTSNPVPGGS